MSKIDITTISEGLVLSPLLQEIAQNDINLYAEASRDFNPIHIDEKYAKSTPLGGTIAHGMLVLAHIWKMMVSNFGDEWNHGGRLNVKFKNPARPGDTVTISGTVRKVERRENLFVKCDLLCSNQAGEIIISGDAELKTSGAV